MTTPATSLAWCMPYGQLAWLKAANSAVAAKFFDSGSFVVGSSPMPGLGAQAMPLFASFADYAKAGNMQGSNFPWVCCDFENWAKTPEIEKRHVKLTLYAFAQLAHARGQKVLAAPSRDVIYAKAADEPWQWPETIDAGYLRVGIPLASRDSEIFLCQSQGDEKDTAAFTSLLVAAERQTDPSQGFWAALTTNFATASQMKLAYHAAMTCGATINGWWVTIADQTQAATAVSFFNSLA